MTSQQKTGRCSYLYKVCLRKGDAARRGAREVNETSSSALQKAVEIWSWLAFQLAFVHTACFTIEINWYGETVTLRASCCAWCSARYKVTCNLHQECSGLGCGSCCCSLSYIRQRGKADLPCEYRIPQVKGATLEALCRRLAANAKATR